MVRVETSYAGGLRTVSRHGPSGAELVTDAPRDNEGQGESFSPTDLVATALSTCMLTIMGIVARRHGWPLEGATASVEKQMQAEPRRIARLRVVFELPAALDDAARKKLEAAALTCPVHRSLHPAVEIPAEFRYLP